MIEIEFFNWIREIEFKRLKKYYIDRYEKEDSEESYLIKKYLDFEFKKYDENEFEELINKFKKEQNYTENEFEELINKFKKEQFFYKNKKKEFAKQKEIEILKIYDTICFIKNYLYYINNSKYDKIRKHKIIYFIFAFAINKNSDFKLWKDGNDIFNSFYNEKNKNKKISFCAFENGPILETIYFSKNSNPPIGEDDNLIISVDNEKKLFTFEMAYFLLREFSTLQLIKESHKTDPWEKNYQPDKYFVPIKNEEIIKYFEKNKPFILKLLEDGKK
ncbi:/ / hypothetical protein / 276340:277128 Reverse [Candidatus Hepatoplasma crinochetorum]|uniref:Antitoxin SocA-like Panacea domain-containing protein n=1 Tax=Candidatus Hepatoplasma crinochetorum TaxID=295596 RepID=A0A0G7ZMD9_9MOLU|nr:/ / hypothetical protein / 276340:277128 Reverse [Candidatus Hepatoplasma crinochetorum]